MSMLLPSRSEASSSPPAPPSGVSVAMDVHHHLHSHLPALHASKLHQYQQFHPHQPQPQQQQQQQTLQADKAASAGVTINMQSVVDADARSDRRVSPLSLPSLLSAQATISPPNSRRYPPPVLAPLRVLPDYCRFPGCANFGKMQGFCHDHIHGRPAAPMARPPAQLLPGLRSVVSPELRACPATLSSPEPLSSPSSYGAFRQPLYPPVMLKRPPPVAIPAAGYVSPPTAHLGACKRPRVLQDESDSSCSTSSAAPKSQNPRATKCRREHCGNDARRKGLCMEHGGRHFCKMAGCSKCAHRGGFCISHGGGRRCAVANCAKSAQSGGICYSHGGGKRCATDGCSHAARSGGFCIKHGKQQRQSGDLP